MSGPIVVVPSRGSPTLRAWVARINRDVNSGTTSWCTNSRCVDVHICPARRKAEATERAAARSRSPSSHTMVGEMLPSSRATGRKPTRAWSQAPMRVLPVNA